MWGNIDIMGLKKNQCIIWNVINFLISSDFEEKYFQLKDLQLFSIFFFIEINFEVVLSWIFFIVDQIFC